jgi:hypothetical protein
MTATQSTIRPQLAEELLTGARRTLTSPGAWHSHGATERADGTRCRSDDPEAARWTVYGALTRAAATYFRRTVPSADPFAGDSAQLLADIVTELYLDPLCDGCAGDWECAENRQQAHVLDVLDRAIAAARLHANPAPMTAGAYAKARAVLDDPEWADMDSLEDDAEEGIDVPELRSAPPPAAVSLPEPAALWRADAACARLQGYLRRAALGNASSLKHPAKDGAEALAAARKEVVGLARLLGLAPVFATPEESL